MKYEPLSFLKLTKYPLVIKAFHHNESLKLEKNEKRACVSEV